MQRQAAGAYGGECAACYLLVGGCVGLARKTIDKDCVACAEIGVKVVAACLYGKGNVGDAVALVGSFEAEDAEACEYVALFYFLAQWGAPYVGEAAAALRLFCLDVCAVASYFGYHHFACHKGYIAEDVAAQKLVGLVDGAEYFFYARTYIVAPQTAVVAACVEVVGREVF